MDESKIELTVSADQKVRWQREADCLRVTLEQMIANRIDAFELTDVDFKNIAEGELLRKKIREFNIERRNKIVDAELDVTVIFSNVSFATFIFSKEISSDATKQVISTNLAGYIKSRENEVYNSCIFMCEQRRENFSIDEYVAEIRAIMDK